MKRIGAFLFILFIYISVAKAEDGSRLWLPVSKKGNDKIEHNSKIESNKNTKIISVCKDELYNYWNGSDIELKVIKDKSLLDDGFKIKISEDKIIISSPSDKGIMYGVYNLIRLNETSILPKDSVIVENPLYEVRVLNHWDNLDGTIERGYAGKSLWEWEKLPTIKSDRYRQYARANASIGINGTVINNVNASPEILSDEYINKIKVLADIFREYGIKIYLSVNFASPMALGKLTTADPLDKDVIKWWKNKVDEIYKVIPDFGGFLVKANSEGQPGPCDFGRSHADGANMLADALKPHKGIVMWRAFVYSPTDSDRAKQAYIEFQPLDGKFRNNVIIQIKNGPVDFQPREPYSPLFGGLPNTNEMVEFQITQEYLGFSNHLAYLAPMWKEFFKYVKPNTINAIAGVSNIGNDVNWCGHPFAAANWYSFGRLAWNPNISAEKIAKEWIVQTFTNDSSFVNPVSDIMMNSREAVVNYMMPLGLHHLFAWGHHYGPEPWCNEPGARADWMPSYYHKATEKSIGFDRSSKGSNAVAQYPEKYRKLYDDITTCPDEYLLWFHNVEWNYKMKNNKTLWDNLCYKYDDGVKSVKKMQKVWDMMEKYIDKGRFNDVQKRLKTQLRDAIWWKDGCLLYFQTFSKMPIPYDIERPIHNLDDMKSFKLNISNYEVPEYGFSK